MEAIVDSIETGTQTSQVGFLENPRNASAVPWRASRPPTTSNKGTKQTTKDKSSISQGVKDKIIGDVIKSIKAHNSREKTLQEEDPSHIPAIMEFPDDWEELKKENKQSTNNYNKNKTPKKKALKDAVGSFMKSIHMNTKTQNTTGKVLSD